MAKQSSQSVDCGIIMPISECSGRSREHWLEVFNILAEAITKIGFKPNMVSESEGVEVIQKTIVQNIYENPIVVCDISCTNPNVMFELGMRITFDKPVVIVMDSETISPFDTNIIRRIEYPRDLRYSKIKAFQEELGKRVFSTFKDSKEKGYSQFTNLFGKFPRVSIQPDYEQVSSMDLILDQLQSLNRKLKNTFPDNQRNIPSQNLRKVETDYVLKSMINAIRFYLGSQNVKSLSDMSNHLEAMKRFTKSETDASSRTSNEQEFNEIFQKAFEISKEYLNKT